MRSSTEERAPETPSLTAAFACFVGVLALVAAAFGPISVQTGLLAQAQGALVSVLGLVPGMLLALLFGTLALWRTRAGSGRRGRGIAWIGVGSGAALLLFVLSLRPWSLWITFHDATTNIADPPQFSNAVRERRAQRQAELGLDWVNAADYPSGSPEHRPPIDGQQVIAFQREYYPDLAPIELHGVRAARALSECRSAAAELGWTITAVDPDAGILEAFDITRFFRFEDDIVVRVRALADGSVVDLRSTSRFRANDMRANAERIRTFGERLRIRLQ